MLPALLVLLFYALHQDLWLWREARPLVLGFLPAGLAYHAAYTLTVPLLMAYLIRRLWPAHLEGPDPGDTPERETGAGAPGVPGGPEPAR